MAYEKGSRPEGGFKRRGPARRRKKVCVFCGKENNEIDYKDVAKLRKYISERGKILPRSSDAVRSGLIDERKRLISKVVLITKNSLFFKA